MVNLSLVGNGILVLINALLFIKVFSVYQNQRDKSFAQPLFDFAIFYLFLALYHGVVMISQVLFSDLLKTAFFASFYHIFLYLVPAATFMVIAGLSNKKNLRPLIFWGFLIGGLTVTVLNLINLKPNIAEIHQGFIFQRGNFPFFIRLLDGVPTLIGSVFAAVYFLRNGFASSNILVKKRSTLIGSGYLLLAISSITAFIIILLIKSALMIFLAIINTIPALLLMLYGMLYGHKEILTHADNEGVDS